MKAQQASDFSFLGNSTLCCSKLNSVSSQKPECPAQDEDQTFEPDLSSVPLPSPSEVCIGLRGCRGKDWWVAGGLSGVSALYFLLSAALSLLASFWAPRTGWQGSKLGTRESARWVYHPLSLASVSCGPFPLLSVVMGSSEARIIGHPSPTLPGGIWRCIFIRGGPSAFLPKTLAIQCPLPASCCWGLSAPLGGPTR